MSSIPEDLYLDILLRVPARSTYACKCVCKSWFQIISDPSFVESHLKLVQKKDPNLVLTNKDHVISSMSYHSLISSSPKEDMFKNCIALDYPFRLSEQYVELVGSCNGLVCLWFKSKGNEGFFCLWNPATTEYKTLPPAPPKYLATTSFCYDDMADDYMLINITGGCFYDDSSMYVYSLRSNSWKSIQTTDHGKFYRIGYGVFVNGAFYLLVVQDKDMSKSIISLDMSSERLVDLQLPNDVNEFILLSDVAVSDGCLSLVVPVNETRCDVWVMQNYGGGEAWVKLYVITRPRMIGDSFKLRIILKNGKNILCRTAENLFLYDTVLHAISREAKPLIRTMEMENYVESLFPLGSGQYVKDKSETQKLLIER